MAQQLNAVGKEATLLALFDTMGGQEIISLPEYPAHMLLEPRVQLPADALRGAINKAIQATSLAA